MNLVIISDSGALLHLLGMMIFVIPCQGEKPYAYGPWIQGTAQATAFTLDTRLLFALLLMMMFRYIFLALVRQILHLVEHAAVKIAK